MTPTTIALAVLVFALVITRLEEERRWRDGRISDRTNALLVAGRLPILGVGFGLITGQEPLGVLLPGALGLGLAALVVPYVTRRLRRIREGAPRS